MELTPERHIEIPPVFDGGFLASVHQEPDKLSPQDVIEALYFMEGRPNMRDVLFALEIPGDNGVVRIVLIFTHLSDMNSAGFVYCRFLSENGDEIHPQKIKKVGKFCMINIEQVLVYSSYQCSVLPELSGLTFEDAQENLREVANFCLRYLGFSGNSGLNA